MLGRGMRCGIGTATFVGVMGAAAVLFPPGARAQSNLGASISSLPTPNGPDDSTQSSDYVRRPTEPPAFDPKSAQAVIERKTHPPEVRPVAAHPVPPPRQVAQAITVNPVNPAIAPLRGGTPPVVAPAPSPAAPPSVTATSPLPPVSATPATAPQPRTSTEVEGEAPATLPANNEPAESRAAAAAPNGEVAPSGAPFEPAPGPEVVNRAFLAAPSVVVTPPPSAEGAPSEGAPETAPAAPAAPANGTATAPAESGAAAPASSAEAPAVAAPAAPTTANAPTTGTAATRTTAPASPNVIGVDSYGRSSAATPAAPASSPAATPGNQPLPPTIGEPADTLPPLGNP